MSNPLPINPRTTVTAVVAGALKRARSYLNTARTELEDQANRTSALEMIAAARREMDAAEQRLRTTVVRRELGAAAAAVFSLFALLLIGVPAPAAAQTPPYQLTITTGTEVEHHYGTFNVLQTAPEGGYINLRVEALQTPPPSEPSSKGAVIDGPPSEMPPLQQWTVTLLIGETTTTRNLSCYGYTHFQPSVGPRAWLVCP